MKEPYRKLKEEYYHKGIRDYPTYRPPLANLITELLSDKLNYETILRIYRVAWKKKEKSFNENISDCCIILR